DEPLSNLDAKLRVQLRAEISRVQKRIGVATLYVTHDQTEAMTLGHRVAVLRDGALQQCDTPQVLYDRPANVFVAGFIGSPSMNLFEASLSIDALTLALGSQSIPLNTEILTRHPALKNFAGQKIVVGIRPEDLPAMNEQHAGVEFKGDVELVEALGSEILVHFRTDAQVVIAEGSPEVPEGPDLDTKTQPFDDCVARIQPRHAVKVCDRFSFTVNPDRLEFFELDSGHAIWE
ncbi:MAG TPA: TOBE domain-containing protein, partial [Acidimicrobiales bacterium]